MLNAIGLANPGRDRFLAEHLPRLRELGLPLWISVGGFCAADYAETCSRLVGIEAIELNLSCPNVDEAADSAAEIVAACRQATELPLFAKLSAAHPDVAEVARAVAAAGADGLSLINTLRGTALDRQLRPVLARGSGGLSGPALKPVALHAVTVCHEATGLPIVGMGGIQTGRDALEFAACLGDAAHAPRRGGEGQCGAREPLPGRSVRGQPDDRGRLPVVAEHGWAGIRLCAVAARHHLIQHVGNQDGAGLGGRRAASKSGHTADHEKHRRAARSHCAAARCRGHECRRRQGSIDDAHARHSAAHYAFEIRGVMKINNSVLSSCAKSRLKSQLRIGIRPSPGVRSVWYCSELR